MTGVDEFQIAVPEPTVPALVLPKLNCLARSVPDARIIADLLEKKGVKLAVGVSIYDPADPMVKMLVKILATFAEFEADLIRMRTKEGMAVARAKGKLRGTGGSSIGDLAEMFAVSRPTVYRTLQRGAVSG